MNNEIKITIDASEATAAAKEVLAQYERIIASSHLPLEPEAAHSIEEYARNAADWAHSIAEYARNAADCAHSIAEYARNAADWAHYIEEDARDAADWSSVGKRSDDTSQRIICDAGAYVVETIKVIGRRLATQAEIEAINRKPNGTVKSAS